MAAAAAEQEQHEQIAAATSPPAPAAPLLFSFGAISDIQYADRADGHNYHRTKTRHYRAALEGLRRAVAAWLQVENEQGNTTAPDGPAASCPFFVLQLGDLLDGFAAATALGSEATLERLLAEFGRLRCPVFHCLGNHEFYNSSSRAYWQRALHPRSPTAYQSFSPHPRFLFIGLDTYDVSVLGTDPGSAARAAAEAVLARNPNEDKNSPVGLVGLEQRFVLFGGGVGPEQLRWLALALEGAERAGQRAVLFSHAPLHPQSCTPDCLCWNYQDILALLARHKGRVALCLAGHAHAARVQVDADGTGAVFVVLDSPLEQSDAFSTVRVYGDRIEVQGVGANANASAVVPL